MPHGLDMQERDTCNKLIDAFLMLKIVDYDTNELPVR